MNLSWTDGLMFTPSSKREAAGIVISCMYYIYMEKGVVRMNVRMRFLWSCNAKSTIQQTDAQNDEKQFYLISLAGKIKKNLAKTSAN